MMILFIALLHKVSQCLTLLPLLIRRINHSWNHPSSLGVYSSIAAILAHIGLIKHNNQLCPHRYPLTPGWREAIMVKCLAQGHKHHGHGRGSNPHSDDSTIRIQMEEGKLTVYEIVRVGLLIVELDLNLFWDIKIHMTLEHCFNLFSLFAFFLTLLLIDHLKPFKISTFKNAHWFCRHMVIPFEQCW